MRSFRNTQWQRIRTGFAYLDGLLHLSDIVDNLIRFLAALHNALATILLTGAQFLPLIGILIEGLGYLASPIKALFFQNHTAGEIDKMGLGLKVITGMVMVGCAITGFLIPPLGLTLAVAGLGASVGVSLYKARCSSIAIARAESGSDDALPEPGIDRPTIDDHKAKLKHRVVNLGLIVVNTTLLALSVFCPPVSVFALGLLACVNLGYFCSSVKQRMDANSPVASTVHPGDDDGDGDGDVIEQSDVSEIPASDNRSSIASLDSDGYASARDSDCFDADESMRISVVSARGSVGSEYESCMDEEQPCHDDRLGSVSERASTSRSSSISNSMVSFHDALVHADHEHHEHHVALSYEQVHASSNSDGHCRRDREESGGDEDDCGQDDVLAMTDDDDDGEGEGRRSQDDDGEGESGSNQDEGEGEGEGDQGSEGMHL